MESLTVETDVDLETIHTELCEQGIARSAGQEMDHFYLAALALGTKDDKDYNINDTLVEFIRNASTLDLTRDEADQIEELLR